MGVPGFLSFSCMLGVSCVVRFPSGQIFLAQTRTARVGIKLARNLAAEIPFVTHLFLGLLQAPEQVGTIDRLHALAWGA